MKVTELDKIFILLCSGSCCKMSRFWENRWSSLRVSCKVWRYA